MWGRNSNSISWALCNQTMVWAWAQHSLCNKGRTIGHSFRKRTANFFMCTGVWGGCPQGRDVEESEPNQKLLRWKLSKHSESHNKNLSTLCGRIFEHVIFCWSFRSKENDIVIILSCSLEWKHHDTQDFRNPVFPWCMGKLKAREEKQRSPQPWRPGSTLPHSGSWEAVPASLYLTGFLSHISHEFSFAEK